MAALVAAPIVVRSSNPGAAEDALISRRSLHALILMVCLASYVHTKAFLPRGNRRHANSASCTNALNDFRWDAITWTRYGQSGSEPWRVDGPEVGFEEIIQ
jgi:hypothetical protein